jgi:hypothetical protein
VEASRETVVLSAHRVQAVGAVVTTDRDVDVDVAVTVRPLTPLVRSIVITSFKLIDTLDLPR